MLMSSWAEMKAAEGSRKAASRNREGKVGSREEKVGRREEVAIGEKTGSKAATVGSWAVGSWAAANITVEEVGIGGGSRCRKQLCPAEPQRMCRCDPRPRPPPW